MQDAKEEVRSRLNIEDVIGEYVPLQRAGRNFKGLSPFTGEKTASFYVSPDKNIWHDFSSNKGGDVFSFIMEVEGVGFRDALELLARKAGVDLSIYDTQGSQEVARLKKRLLSALDLAARYYQQSLVKNPHAIDYVFKTRGLSKAIVQSFRIGYAPTSKNALVSFLKRKGYSEKELAQAGLTNRFGGDLFRGRMTVPLMDGSGQVIGFTARIIGDADPNAPKYLNTPETILYNKGRHVFGLSQAKEAIRQQNYSVIVEGNLDVVSSHQAGMTQVVATAGTALTEHHLKALVRLSTTVKFAFDGDKAGLAATERAIPIAQDVGVEIFVVTLPEGVKDPDELIQQDPALWQAAIDQAKPALAWVIDQYAIQSDLRTVHGKSEFVAATTAIIRDIKDGTAQREYIEKIRSMAMVREEVITRALEAPAEPRVKELKTVKAVPRHYENDPTSYQDSLLALGAMYQELRPLLSEVSEPMLATPERRQLLTYLQSHPNELLDPLPEGLQEVDTYVRIVLLKADTRYEAWADADRALEASRLVRQVVTEHKQIQKDRLVAQLRTAEESGDDVMAADLRGQLNTLIKEISNAKK